MASFDGLRGGDSGQRIERDPIFEIAVFFILCARVGSISPSGLISPVSHPSKKWVNSLIFRNMWCGTLIQSLSCGLALPENNVVRSRFHLHLPCSNSYRGRSVLRRPRLELAATFAITFRHRDLSP